MYFTKKVMVFFAVVLFCAVPRVDACINLELNFGVVDNAEGRMLAEIISTIILERTGVKVGLHYFENSEKLAEAVKLKQIEIMVENTASALRLEGLPAADDADVNLEAVRSAFREKGLVWMKPFGFMKKTDSGITFHTASIVTREVLDKFPGLPRVLNKLVVIDDETRLQLLAEARNKKTRQVAKDFLIAKRFI